MPTRLKDKSLALFFTCGVSLEAWRERGMLAREVALYNELSKHFREIYFFTYGGPEETGFRDCLAENIVIVPKKGVKNDLLYSFLMPFIHRRLLKKIHFLKTNQMWGAWSAVLAKVLYRKKLLVRTGYVLSDDIAVKKRGLFNRLVSGLERLAYGLADGIITTSQAGFRYIAARYRPRAIPVVVPNYVETDIFKPLDTAKTGGSLCFLGRLNPQKNLPALLEALRGLPYTLDIIGSGEQGKDLRDYAEALDIKLKLLGNMPNHELPSLLNRYEVFALPSLWEGMPKALLEAMACGLPVVAARIEATLEIIDDGRNGILCDADAASLREAIIRLMQSPGLRKKLGCQARKTVEERFSLSRVVGMELELYSRLAG